jgi:hypothetical protein
VAALTGPAANGQAAAPAVLSSCSRDVRVTHGGTKDGRNPPGNGWADANVKVACANGVRVHAWFPPYISAGREGAWVKSGNHSGLDFCASGCPRTPATNNPTSGGYDTGTKTGVVKFHCVWGCHNAAALAVIRAQDAREQKAGARNRAEAALLRL